MKYLHTMLRVKNLEDSLHFFCETLQFKEVRRYDSEQGRFTLVFLCASRDQYIPGKTPLLEITYNWPDENNQGENLDNGRNFGHVAFAVENIYETCQRVQACGVEINRPPRDGRMAFFKTPDGISIELLQEGDSLAPVEPWVSMGNIGSW